MIKIYRKTTTIKAERFDGSAEMIERYDMGFQLAPNGKGGAIIKTLEGDLLVHIGDWIATGVKGEHWAIADDVFKQTYAELPVIPKMVADYIELTQSKVTLFDAMDVILSGYGTLPDWVSSNQDIFARAFINGYQVEDHK